MIRVSIRLFGPAREAAGAGEIVVEVPDRSTAGEVVDALRERFPGLAELLPRSRVAVNHEYVESSTPVRSGDQVAVIPPVGGG